MTIYTCSRCHKDFYQKSNYMSHLNRKFPCEPTSRDNKCSGCGKEFSSHYNMLRHQSKGVCKAPIANVEEPSPERDDKVCQGCGKEFSSHSNMLRHQAKGACKTILELKRKVLELEKSSSRGGSTNNTFNTIINVDNLNMGPTIVSFGNESIDKLTRDELGRIINAGYGAIPKYVELAHLNPRLPDQHNTLVTNLRSSCCRTIGSDGQLSTRDWDTVADNLVRSGVETINHCLSDSNLVIPEETISKLDEVVDRISNSDGVAENTEFKSKTKTIIKRLVYDNKKMIQKSLKTLL